MLNPSLRRALAAGATSLALLGASSAALACSTCKCGDYTINLFGAEKPFEQRFRVGADLLIRSESQGDPTVNARETEETRLLLGLAYSLNEDVTVALQLPFVRKTLEDNTLARQEAEGFGDADLVARWVLYRQGAVSGRHLAGVRAGVRLPTSEQVRDSSGARLDIDVQPDAGAWAPNVGAWYGYYRFPWNVNATVTWLQFANGRQGFDPGNALVASVHGQYGVTQTVALQAGLDARYAQRNRFSGVVDPDSGGTLAMVFAGAAVRLFDELILNAGVQLPLLDRLNGVQEEDPVVRFGFAYDL
ncbi:hypothetical protein JN531_005890 [Flagellatimonas centrodinii]|uniref:hypothetical protein n=1 Tax=Flagellatimonas centrodinii TaxID=2806210 RepID=UPI001FEEF5F6|nr:hypothetical protein [Flagellatimonas centrodinii]ULQ47819.1 hypothetical protein JN531_005890 [Flagellatimonas centrodinii]